MDCSFTDLPYYKNGKAQISSNLFFYNNQKPKVRPPIPHPEALPTLDKHIEDETIVFSEYFFNSLSFALYDAGMMTFTLKSENVPV